MKHIKKFNESISPESKISIHGIDIRKAKELISSWEKDKGNTKHRDIDFLRWYEKNIKFDPMIIKEIGHDSVGNWAEIPLQEIYDYFIEYVDEYNAEIYISKGATSKDTYLTLEFLVDDYQKFNQESKFYNRIIEMGNAFGKMNNKPVNFYKFYVEEKFKSDSGVQSILYFYFRGI
jgi:hypothetical protein